MAIAAIGLLIWWRPSMARDATNKPLHHDAVPSNAAAAGESEAGDSSGRPSPEKSQEQAFGQRISAILRKSDPLERRRDFIAFLDHLAPDQYPLAAKDLYACHAATIEDFALFEDAWSLASPLGAIENAKNGGPPTTEAVLENWAGHDPAAALEWLRTHGSADDETRSALPAVFVAMMAKDPEAAVRETASLSDEDRKSVLPRMGTKAAEMGRDFAEPWLANFPMGSPAHRQALDGLCTTLSTSDPAWSLELVEKYPSEITGEVEQHWAEGVAGSQPEAMLERIVGIQDADLRNRLLVSVIREWRTSNPGSADAWMNQAGLPAEVLKALQETGE